MRRNGCALLVAAAVVLVCARPGPAQDTGPAAGIPCPCCLPPRNVDLAKAEAAGVAAPEDQLWTATGKMAVGDYAAALSIITALAGEAERSGAKHGHTNVALFSLLGIAYQGTGRYLEAEQSFRRVLVLLEEVNPRDEACVIRTLNQLMMLYLGSGQHDKAERTSRRVAHTLASADEMSDFERLSYRYLEASLYVAQRRYAAAQEVLAPALQEAERKLGPEHLLVAHLLNASGQNAALQKNWLEAVRFYERALEINTKVNGPDHPEYATVLTNLAAAYGQTGLTREAEGAFRQALKIMESRLGPDHPNVAAALTGRASLLRNMRRAGEAKALEKRARAIMAQSDAANLLNRTVDVRSLKSQPGR